MATVLQQNERLLHVATCGLRAPDGSIVRNVKLYEIVSEDEIDKRTGLTDGERAACEGIVKEMAAQFGRFVEQTEAQAAGRRSGKAVGE